MPTGSAPGAGFRDVLPPLALATTLLSCVSDTGTQSTLTTADLSKITKTAIVVNVKDPLSVRLARDKMTTTGAALFGLIGAGVEAGYKSSQDSAYEKEVVGLLQGFDPVKEHALAIQGRFRAANLFASEVVDSGTDNAQALRTRGFDAMFRQSIDEWGLRLCSGEENVRVAFDIHAEMVLLGSNTTVWERDELFSDGPCRPLSDFRNDPDLLRASMKQATVNLAGKLVNELAFP